MVINFLALGLIWAYVQRTYPSFEAARYWTGSAFMCATAAAVATLRDIYDGSLLPLLAAGTIMVLATCLAAMGVRCFYQKPVNWERTALITLNAFFGMAFFIYVYDSAPARLTIFTAAQALPLVLSLKMLLSPPDGRKNAGAQLAAIVVILIVTIYSLRLMAGLTGAAGGFTFTHHTYVQSLLTLVLVFLSMAVNFGFLLMAIDRLRSEVADLALMDDLTGVANRRHLLQRLTEECARSERSGEAFALLVIDLDGWHQRHPWSRRGRCLPAALHPDGADAAAARRHAGAHRRRRILHRAAVLHLARGRDDRPPRPRGVPRRCRRLRRHRHSDFGLHWRCAVDALHGRFPGPADRGRRPRALRGQARRPQPICRLRPVAALGARPRA